MPAIVAPDRCSSLPDEVPVRPLPMFDIVLYQPDSAQYRQCDPPVGNAGVRLHLVEPLGSTCPTSISHALGSTHDLAHVIVIPTGGLPRTACRARLFALTTKGSRRHDAVAYREGDVLVFGPESRGLPPEAGRFAPEFACIPMRPTNRSINLSNAVVVVVYKPGGSTGLQGQPRDSSPQCVIRARGSVDRRAVSANCGATAAARLFVAGRVPATARRCGR